MVKPYGSQYGFSNLSRQILETPQGRLTVTDLYLAHFLGANGDATLLNAADETPGSDATALLPAAAKANAAIFMMPDGARRSTAQVVKLIRDRFTDKIDRYASSETVMNNAAPRASRPAPSVAAPAGDFGNFDIRQAHAGGRISPVNYLVMDQLMRLIAAIPMSPPDDGSDDDPFQPLSSGSLSVQDWANAMNKSVTLVPQNAPARPAATRAYGSDSVESRRKLNGII